MKFLTQLFVRIKNIFIKNKNLINNIENISQEEQVIEKYEDLYNKIEVGDIIWAKRYKNEIEKETIVEGHREGPFIVIEKQNGKLICTQGTSVVPYEEYYDINFYLGNDGYNLSKPTYFKLNKLDFINTYSFIKVVDKLQEKDKNKLFKHIKKLHKTYYTKDSKIIRLNLPFQVGDIITKDNNNYIIIDINENNMICISLKNNVDYRNELQLNFNNFNDLNYSNTTCFENDNSIKYINTVNSKCIKYILSRWQEYINNCKNIKVTQRGSIILKDNRYYYIYGEECQDWLAFELSKEYIQNLERIEIANQKYYTKYDDLKINKKDEFNNVYLCSDKDKTKIKQARKDYKETVKNKQNDELSKQTSMKQSIAYIALGTTIKINEFSEETFVVDEILGDILVCVSSIDLGIKNPRKHYFNKNNVIVVQNKQKRR